MLGKRLVCVKCDYTKSATRFLVFAGLYPDETFDAYRVNDVETCEGIVWKIKRNEYQKLLNIPTDEQRRILRKFVERNGLNLDDFDLIHRMPATL